MLVTIFTDASFCRHLSVGGWGAWFKSERGSLQFGGPFRGRVLSSLHAEAQAIVNAVHLSRATGIAVLGDDLLVQTDCTAAITWFEGRAVKHRETAAELAALVRKIHPEGSITYRHVPGHAGFGTRRTAVNEICDALAASGLERAKVAARSSQPD